MVNKYRLLSKGTRTRLLLYSFTRHHQGTSANDFVQLTQRRRYGRKLYSAFYHQFHPLPTTDGRDYSNYDANRLWGYPTDRPYFSRGITLHSSYKIL